MISTGQLLSEARLLDDQSPSNKKYIKGARL